jgi:hypothetical protein
MEDLIRKRDEEEDEVIMLFILPALYILTSGEQRQKRPRHTSRLSRKERLKEILEGHPKDCCEGGPAAPSICFLVTLQG